MKKLFKSTLVLGIVALMASCGVDSSSIQGEWKMDPKGLEIKLGDHLPDAAKQQVEGMNISEMAAQQMGDVTIKLNEDHSIEVNGEKAPEGEEVTWDVSGSNLVLKGKAEGQEYSINLPIAESTGDKLVLKLDAVELYNQVLAQLPEEQKAMMTGMGAQMGVEGEITDALAGTSATIAFVKGGGEAADTKEAH